MMNTILPNPKQNKYDKTVDRFMHNHPCIAFLALFIGMPIFILIAVFACAAAIMIIMSQIMGWI